MILNDLCLKHHFSSVTTSKNGYSFHLTSLKNYKFTLHFLSFGCSFYSFFRFIMIRITINLYHLKHLCLIKSSIINGLLASIHCHLELRDFVLIYLVFKTLLAWNYCQGLVKNNDQYFLYLLIIYSILDELVVITLM